MHTPLVRVVHFTIFLLALVALAACSRYEPVEARFEASPARITAGESTTLTWGLDTQPTGPLPRPGTVSYVLLLDPGSVDVTDMASLEVSPETTTAYELVARWGGQEVRAQTTVVVDEAAGEPEAEPDVDEPPVATADTYSVARGTTLDVAAAAGVLANDTDPEGATLATELVEGPAHGTLDLAADGSFQYVHDGGASTTDVFRYRVAADGVVSEAVTVTLEVLDVNEAPTATDGSFTAYPGDPFEVDLAALASDPEGDVLTFEIVAGPAFGTASVAGSTLTYTPAADASSADEVTVTVSDGDLVTEFVVSFAIGGYISDPAGDHTYLADQDALGLRWYRDGDDVVFEIELTTEQQAGGYMGIDLDRDQATGSGSDVTMYCADAPASGYELDVLLFTGEVTDSGGSPLGTATIEAAGTFTTVRFPLSWAGGDLALDPYMIVGMQDPSDCVPGAGGGYVDGIGGPA